MTKKVDVFNARMLKHSDYILSKPYLDDDPTALPLKCVGPLAWCRRVIFYKAALAPEHSQANEIESFLGFDTGSRHAGLAQIYGNNLRAWQIEWSDFPGYAEGVQYVYNVVKQLAGDTQVNLFGVPALAVIEAGAFSRAASTTTTNLEALRTAALLAFRHLNYPVEMKAPNTITKQIHGDGRLKSSEVWAGLFDKDAAAAVGCALLAKKLKETA